MKIVHINAESLISIEEVLKKVNLNGKIGLISSIQYIHQLKKAKKILKNSIIIGQVLGCNVDNAIKFKDKVDSFLYIGSGNFHPFKIALETQKPVYIANPETNEFNQLESTLIRDYEKRKRGSQLRFLSSNKVGILVSTKLGQHNLNEVLKLKKTLKKENYIFLFDTLSLNELENFPDIDVWINTACIRLEGKSIINLEDLPKID